MSSIGKYKDYSYVVFDMYLRVAVYYEHYNCGKEMKEDFVLPSVYTLFHASLLPYFYACIAVTS
jgi:hypothetical protein